VKDVGYTLYSYTLNYLFNDDHVFDEYICFVLNQTWYGAVDVLNAVNRPLAPKRFIYLPRLLAA
jgi:hypothetical protein